MKARRIGTAALILAALTGGLVLADIEGSKHDFSNKAWGGDLCSACHAPHSSKPPAAAPLWDPQADPQRTLDAPVARRIEAGSGTLLCLRCHDGTIAADTGAGGLLNRLNPRQTRRFPGPAHERSNHPVGVKYPSVQRGYRPAAGVLSGGSITLPAGRVECISCHDPHNAAGQKYMLVQSNARSALCLACHQK